MYTESSGCYLSRSKFTKYQDVFFVWLKLNTEHLLGMDTKCKKDSKCMYAVEIVRTKLGINVKYQSSRSC